MAYIDEKIALLEREARRQKAERVPNAEEQERRQEYDSRLTLEEILAMVRDGSVTFPDGESFEIIMRETLSGRVPILSVRDIFSGPEENEGAAALVDNERGISQMVALADRAIFNESIGQWKKRMVDGMKAMGLYTEVTCEKVLENLDYLIYRMPTAKGWTHNIAFRMKTEEGMAAGNYNCYERDKETYGLLLEALVVRLNEILSDGVQNK